MQNAAQFRRMLCSEMFMLKARNILCDTIINSADQSHPCHKLVLAAASPILREIIQADCETTGEVSDLNLQLDCLSALEVECLLEYLYTGNVTKTKEINSVLYITIEVFTEELYAGLSWDDVINLLESLLCNEASRDSTAKDSSKITEKAELNGRTFLDESQIICHIETNRSGRQSVAARVHSSPVEIESIGSKRPRSTDDAQMSPQTKRSRLNNDAGMKRASYVRSIVKLPRKPPFLCPCQNCGKIFESNQKLRSHYRHTHGDKKYKCDLCPLRFLYPKDLRSHVRTHTGEKPFVCEICGKGFSQMGSLTIHHKTHDKRDNDSVVFRPCPECSKKYCLKDRDKNVDYLNDCSGDLSSCICPNSNCAKKFSCIKSLKNHLKNDVCNPNKYHCGKCYTKFDSNIQLRYHVGTLHCTHKKRKKVRPCNKKPASLDDHDYPVQLLEGFVNDIDVSPMLCNVEAEISGLLRLSEEVVIKGDE